MLHYAMKKISIILQLCRVSLAILWLYQGVVPKLMGPHADELTMNQSIQPFWLSPEQISLWAGIGEVIFGLLIFVLYRKRSVYIWNIIALIGLFLATVFLTPQFVTAAFNSFTINFAMIILGCIALVCLQGDGSEWTYQVK